MMRNPIVAGQFYEFDPEKLEAQIEDSFTNERGPGSLPGKRGEKMIKGAIAPHAGYMFSGPCAAHTYKALAESKAPNAYIILGISHLGFHKSCISLDDWDTPIGQMKTAGNLGRIMELNGIECIPTAHDDEHSIEVQIPFLKFITKDIGYKAKFVPVIIAQEDWLETAQRIRKSIDEYRKKHGKDVCVIASSDFTHYGHNYGFIPFTKDVKENLYKLDSGAVSFIRKLDSKGFLDYCEKTEATICGKYSIAALIEILKPEAKNVKVLSYYTSGDIVNDYGTAVGYASIIIE